MSLSDPSRRIQDQMYGAKEPPQAMREVIRRRAPEIDAHLEAIADILTAAGADDPVNALTLTSGEMPSVWSLLWERGA